jgi:dipeptidyl aminopeptidase/acylaminoacyl peptidase
MIFSPLAGRAALARPAICTILLSAALPALGAATAAAPNLQDLRAIAAANTALAPAPRLALDAFLSRPAMREIRLSPDGRRVAFFLQTGGASLNVYDIASASTQILAKDAPRGSLAWSTDGGTLFIDDAADISAVNASEGAVTKAATYDKALENKMLNVDLRRPHHMLASDFDRKAGIYRLFSYAADGTHELLYQGAPLRDALLDAKGQPFFTKSLAADYAQIISRRAGNGWKEVMRCKPVHPCTMLAASADGKRLKMMMAYQSDRTALIEVDARTGAQHLLHTDPQAMADMRSVAADPQSGEILAACHELPQRRCYAVAATARTALADIGARFAGSSISLTASAGGKRWLIAETAGDLQQPRYWLYDASTRQASEILQAERALGKPLAQEVLAPKHAFTYRASDGMPVHGYLTLPRGADAGKIALVTMVHGGPWSRFDGDYHWLVQWLANRGVAVFQPNFRASTGYGEKYMLAPGMDFGNGRVQGDVIEGVQWLLANGIGDKAHLAILGDSFGGYTTLMALTHTPEMFQFGFAAVPPPDFARVIELASSENLAGTEDLPTGMRFQQLGISQANAAAMAALRRDSPLAGAGRLVRPLVILAGGQDDKVEIASVAEYVARLQAAGKPVTLLVDPDEGHNPRKPLIRLAYAHLLERMLHDYLGTERSEDCAPDLCRYLEQTIKVNKAFRE